MSIFDILTPNNQPPHDSWRWATVTDTDPLMIRFDGDTVSLPVDSTLISAANLLVGHRVWCQLFGRRLILLGVGNGSGGGGGTPGPPGPPGADGADGSLWYVSGIGGVNDPEDVADPHQGDQFLYSNSGDIFSYEAGAWVYSANIAGPEGPEGPEGPPGVAGGLLICTVKVFDANGSYTPPADLVFARVRAVGGGGGGGGSNTSANTTSSSGGGGGGGGYGESTLTKAQIDAALVSGSIPVTVGAGGTTAVAEAGGAGGGSSFGTLVVVGGGGGGGISSASGTVLYAASGGSGGGVTTAQIKCGGSDGAPSLRSPHGSGGAVGGQGGASGMGGGGGKGVRSFDDTSGAVGSIYGGGGGGTASGGSTDTNNAHSGGVGARGVVIVEEYTPATTTTVLAGVTVKTTAFVADGTYTKDPNLVFARIQVIGAGGGGGGVPAQPAGASGHTGGGGGGGFAEAMLLAAQVGATEAVTVGAGGVAGTPTVSGGNGGNSAFGAHLTAGGGQGSAFGGTATAVYGLQGGPGGTFGGAAPGLYGAPGGPGETGPGGPGLGWAGMGGHAGNGSGGAIGPRVGSSGQQNAGNNATGFGGGGSGAVVAGGGTAVNGGAGAPGLVIVQEYISTTPQSYIDTKVGKCNTVVMTASGNYTPPSDLLFARIRVQAGGGGSAGTGTASGAATSSSGGGGGGGYAESILSVAEIQAALVSGVIPVTVGAGGTAGPANGPASGGNGGNSSFGTLVAATGGTGSEYSAAESTNIFAGANGVGGDGTAGQLQLGGNGGGIGMRSQSATGGGAGGTGGPAVMGGGGRGRRSISNVNGTPGHNYGGGAGGTSSGGGQNTAHTGAAGGPGVVVIEEYRAGGIGQGDAKGAVVLGVARSNAVLTLSATSQDVPGCSTGPLSLVAGDLVEVDATFDFQNPGSTAIGVLDINGTEQSGQALLTSATTRATVGQGWIYTVPSSGSYTFKLRARVSSTLGGTANTAHTSFKWKVWR